MKVWTKLQVPLRECYVIIYIHNNRLHTHTHIRRSVLMLYLIEKSLRKLLKALSTHEALLVIQLAVTVDDLLGWGKATLTTLT